MFRRQALLFLLLSLLLLLLLLVILFRNFAFYEHIVFQILFQISLTFWSLNDIFLPKKNNKYC